MSTAVAAHGATTEGSALSATVGTAFRVCSLNISGKHKSSEVLSAALPQTDQIFLFWNLLGTVHSFIELQVCVLFHVRTFLIPLLNCEILLNCEVLFPY